MTKSKMKILVTGGEGFLGQKLVEDLTGKGHEVFTYDFVSGKDICNYEQFYESLKECGADTVIHLAAIADLYIMRAKPESSWKINVEGTRNVMNACKALGARCLFASTCCCYGNNDCHPSDENSPLCPTEIYAKSKKEGEKIMEEEQYADGKHTRLRLATFYGPTMRSALVHAVFLRKAHRGEELLVHGNGEQTRTYTHCDDVVSGIVSVTLSDKYYPVVNITNDESWSVLDVAKFAIEATGNNVPIRHVEDRPGQIYKEYINNDRLKSTGWRPKWSLREGMKDSYEGLKPGLIAEQKKEAAAKLSAEKIDVVAA